MEANDQAAFEPANIRPFLRWAGSKRKLLKHLTRFVPNVWGKYYEPFLGGGSMFFYLGPKQAEISDASMPLIETYRAVRQRSDMVLKFLSPLKANKENFNRLKTYAPRSVANRAAQFIFLNKTCWNGLYRVNSDGIFNVPYGQPKTDFVINEKNFKRCALQLRRRAISIRCQDFLAIEDRVGRGDFVFLDPPYVTSHNMNGFIDWNESLFSWSDQVRLAEMAGRLVRRGANLLITNADHADIRRLYADFNVYEFSRHSTLASNTAYRVVTSELVLFAGPSYRQGSFGDRRFRAPIERGVAARE